MKRFKNLVIGGIQNKIVNLILITVLLLTAAFVAVSSYNSNMLSQLAGESSRKQRASITEITSTVMDRVVIRSMERTVGMQVDAIGSAKCATGWLFWRTALPGCLPILKTMPPRLMPDRTQTRTAFGRPR